MIEVFAKLDRGTVYLAGESIEGQVTFTNKDEHDEKIAWVSVQFHCECSVNQNRVTAPPSYEQPPNERDLQRGVTSGYPVGAVAPVVFKTNSIILAVDVRLRPGESREYTFQEKIPPDAPPSYSGGFVKYCYKMTVVLQRVSNKESSELHRVIIPFRVMVLYGLSEYHGESNPVPANPFMEEARAQQQPANLLDLASDLLNRITARRSLNVYRIANSRGAVGSFSISKSSYKLGEDIVASFDFSEGTVPCLQISVCLQAEEQIADEYKRRLVHNHVTSYGRQVEPCLFAKRTHLILPVPLFVCPGFLTELLLLKWRLHFEFTTSVAPLEGQNLQDEDKGILWQGPFQLKTEQTVWDLPIRILPTLPSLAESGIAEGQITKNI